MTSAPKLISFIPKIRFSRFPPSGDWDQFGCCARRAKRAVKGAWQTLELISDWIIRFKGDTVLFVVYRRSMRTSMMENKHLKKQLDSFEDHRPYFTYWTCTVQVLIMLVAIFTYGFGPVGFNLNRRSGLVRNIRFVDFFGRTRRSIVSIFALRYL